MQEVDRFGIGKTMEMALDHLCGKKERPLHMSYDIDAVDPVLAPSTGTKVRGGLTWREANYVAEAAGRDQPAVRPRHGRGEPVARAGPRRAAHGGHGAAAYLVGARQTASSKRQSIPITETWSLFFSSRSGSINALAVEIRPLQGVEKRRDPDRCQGVAAAFAKFAWQRVLTENERLAVPYNGTEFFVRVTEIDADDASETEFTMPDSFRGVVDEDTKVLVSLDGDEQRVGVRLLNADERAAGQSLAALAIGRRARDDERRRGVPRQEEAAVPVHQAVVCCARGSRRAQGRHAERAGGRRLPHVRSRAAVPRARSA
ncbi:hypothetical protein PINS_up023176 [Pythium insidiosum]|nr:hypothetical protein PINS_up023176 [Pythium insidiosum]